MKISSKMKQFFLFLCLLPICAFAQNEAPILSNVKINVDYSAQKMTISYDLQDKENDMMSVSLWVADSTNQNRVKVVTATGAIGDAISAGISKEIIWIYKGQGKNDKIFNINLIADDAKVPSVTSILQEVNCDRMMADLAFLAKKPRQRNTNNIAHLDASRDTILKILQSAVDVNANYETFNFGNAKGKNIIATKLGTVQENKSYIIDGHYDTVSNAPGADDNGSGTVGMLEAARILGKYNFKKSLKFIAFDMEEDGLVGSKNFAKNLTSNEIDGVFNFEMIGFYNEKPNAQTLPTGFNILFPEAYAMVAQDSFRGNFITNVGNTASNDLMMAFNTAATKYVPALKVIPTTVPGTGTIAPDLRRSDHASFWDKNIKALMLTDGANFRNKNYHSASDTLGSINKNFLCNVVKTTIAAVVQLAELDHSAKYSTTINKPVATDDKIDNIAFNLNPNPVSDILTLECQHCPTLLQHIAIFDLAGKLILEQTLESPSKIATVKVQSLAKGAYLLQTDWGTKRFVKE
jgi:Peptidase family M28/Secretion system C-terminal sorting domain